MGGWAKGGGGTLRALKWPFSTKDIDKRLQVINDHKATFTLALISDNL